MSQLEVLEIFLHDELIGTITQLSGDKNLYTFSRDYIENTKRPLLSLSFKDKFGELITDIKATRRRLPPFFANLLPEGPMREYLARHAQANPEREFYLLSALGNDLPGAIRVGPIIHVEDKEPPKPLSKEEGALHFSLAGVQLKFSAIWEKQGRLTIPANGMGGSWIVKLPSRDYPLVPQNEYSMMTLAERVGIDVPEIALIPLDKINGIPKDLQKVETHAYVIKRFDRTSEGAVHIEDFAQIFGVYPEQKYLTANYGNLAKVISNEVGNEGVIEFIRRLVFSALIGNGDMHLKNWSLIYPNKYDAKLAPAYDFVSTLPYIAGDQLALNFMDSKAYTSFTLERFRKFADKLKFSEALVIETVQETVSRFREAWKNTPDLPLENTFRDQMNAHLKTVPIYNRIE